MRSLLSCWAQCWCLAQAGVCPLALSLFSVPVPVCPSWSLSWLLGATAPTLPPGCPDVLGLKPAVLSSSLSSFLQGPDDIPFPSIPLGTMAFLGPSQKCLVSVCGFDLVCPGQNKNHFQLFPWPIEGTGGRSWVGVPGAGSAIPS